MNSNKVGTVSALFSVEQQDADLSARTHAIDNVTLQKTHRVLKGTH